MIHQKEIDDLRDAFAANSRDLGVGLYHPPTGEIRLGSYDVVTLGTGHPGLLAARGLVDDGAWRGFIVTSDGLFSPVSHFNHPDGGLAMLPHLAAQVEQALRAVGLVQ